MQYTDARHGGLPASYCCMPRERMPPIVARLLLPPFACYRHTQNSNVCHSQTSNSYLLDIHSFNNSVSVTYRGTDKTHSFCPPCLFVCDGHLKLLVCLRQVLDLFHNEFGRAVVFEYDSAVTGPTPPPPPFSLSFSPSLPLSPLFLFLSLRAEAPEISRVVTV
jgi:hypothetical protein